MSEQFNRDQLALLKQRLAWVAGLVWLLVAIALAQQVLAGERPFNERDLTGWKAKEHASNESHWTVGSATIHPEDPRAFVVDADGSELINARGHGVNICTEAVYGDHVVELEVMIPRGSNSAIFVHGEYQVQILDSYTRSDEPTHADMGGIYGVAAPRDPIYHKHGEWNSFRIEFRAPRFDADGEKIENAVFKRIVLNGRTIHESHEMTDVTRGGIEGCEKPQGPLMLQGDHGPVSFRNIRITPLD